MSDLEAIERRLGELRTTLEPIQAEMSELEVAARVIRRLNSSNGHSAAKPVIDLSEADSSDFNSLTIAQAAAIILKEQPNKTAHFRAVAKEAMQRGYKGRRNSAPASVTQSFWATMKRHPETFTPGGNGIYRLLETGVT